MKPTRTVELELHPERDDLGKGKELRDGLSVALQIGDTRQARTMGLILRVWPWRARVSSWGCADQSCVAGR